MTDNASTDANRCSWRDGPNRCAYLARVFPNATEQTRNARLERGLCFGHHFHGGADILNYSHKAMPIDFDYSSPNLVEISKAAYLAGPEREPGQEG